MNNGSEVKKIVEKFTNFSHHGYTIGRHEATELGLPVVKEVDETLEECIWNIWEDSEKEMKCKVPFDPLAIIGGNKELMERLSIIPNYLSVGPLGSPGQQQRIENVSDESIVALIESRNVKSYYKSKAMISAVRGNNLSIACNVAIVSIGWMTKYIGSEMDGTK